MTTLRWNFENNNAVVFDRNDNQTFLESHAYPIVETEEGFHAAWILGGDLRILKSARVSNMGNGMKSFKEDQKLLKYLWNNKHISPFEQVQLCFTVICDLRTAMQMDTHRTLTKNRYSRRYSHDWTEFIKPIWRVQNTEKGTNRQGGDALMVGDDALDATYAWQMHCRESVKRYEYWLHVGMAREQAAYFLPRTLTATYYTVTLRHLIDFIFTRCESHAQKEIREIAYCLKNEVLPLTNPWVAELVTKEFEKNEWEQKL